MKAELIEIMEVIITRRYSSEQSIDNLLEYGFELTGWIARSGQLMSEAKEALHRARRNAYHAAELKLKAKGKDFSPMLLKDYINDTCAEENALYELAERTNRACTHANDLIRTAISALKADRYSSQFNNAA